MPLSNRKVLGVAVEENAVLAAELQMTGDALEITHAARFQFPEEPSLEAPTALGKALGQFLREGGFKARRVVIGLPAKWLMSREKEVPPASEAALGGIMRIQAERDFSTISRKLAVDCSTPEAGLGKSQTLLLVATLRRRVDQVAAMARAARLTVLAITSSVMAIAAAAPCRPSPTRLLLHLRPDAADLALQRDGRFHALMHLPLAAAEAPEACAETLAHDVRRVWTLMPHEQTAHAPGELLVWDGIGFDRGALQALADRLSLRLKMGDTTLADLGVAQGPFADTGEAHRFVGAAALGIAGLQPERLVLDFLHSRLAPDRKKVLGKRAVWAAAVAAALALAFLIMVLGWRATKGEVALLQARLDGMSEDVRAAEDVVERVSFARGWYDNRPRFLECMRGLALIFPAEGRIWSTSLALKDDMRGIVSGRSLDERTVLEVLDRLTASGDFADTKLLYMRQADRAGREVAFAVSFRFVAPE